MSEKLQDAGVVDYSYSDWPELGVRAEPAFPPPPSQLRSCDLLFLRLHVSFFRLRRAIRSNANQLSREKKEIPQE